MWQLVGPFNESLPRILCQQLYVQSGGTPIGEAVVFAKERLHLHGGDSDPPIIRGFAYLALTEERQIAIALQLECSEIVPDLIAPSFRFPRLARGFAVLL